MVLLDVTLLLGVVSLCFLALGVLVQLNSDIDSPQCEFAGPTNLWGDVVVDQFEGRLRFGTF